MQRHSSIDETGSLHQPNTGVSGSRYVGEIVSGGTPLASWMLLESLSGKDGHYTYQICRKEKIAINRKVVESALFGCPISLHFAATSSGTCLLNTVDLLAQRNVLSLVIRHSIRSVPLF